MLCGMPSAMCERTLTLLWSTSSDGGSSQPRTAACRQRGSCYKPRGGGAAALADSAVDSAARHAVVIAHCASDAAHAIAMEANGGRGSDEAVSDVAHATARAAGVVAEIAYIAARRAESYRIDSRTGDPGANYVIASVASEAAAAAVVTRNIVDAGRKAVAGIESHGVQTEGAIGGTEATMLELSGSPMWAAGGVESAITEAVNKAAGGMPGRGTLAAVAADAAQSAAIAVAQTAAAAAVGAAAARQIGGARGRPASSHGGEAAAAAAAAVARSVCADPTGGGTPPAYAPLHGPKEGASCREPAVAAAINRAVIARRRVDEAVSAARAVAARADSDMDAALRCWNPAPGDRQPLPARPLP